jgi:hypothetical protein
MDGIAAPSSCGPERSFGAREYHMKNWSYSLALIPLYLGTFALWQHFPSRWLFVAGGAVTTFAMALLLTRAKRRGYFAGKLDLVLHGIVAADVFAEGCLYEFCRAAFGAGEELTVLRAVHGNFGYVACAAAFMLVIGVHRAYALRRQPPGSWVAVAQPEPILSESV